MMRVALDEAPQSVQDFIQSLELNEDGLELQLAGRVLCVVRPAKTEPDESLHERALRLLDRVRARNAGVEDHVIEAEVEKAIDIVRGRG